MVCENRLVKPGFLFFDGLGRWNSCRFIDGLGRINFTSFNPPFCYCPDPYCELIIPLSHTSKSPLRQAYRESFFGDLFHCLAKRINASLKIDILFVTPIHRTSRRARILIPLNILAEPVQPVH